MADFPTAAMTRKIGRSKYAVDVMFRIWDNYNHRWMAVNGKTIWASRARIILVREKLVEQGRDPDTLEVTRVFVEVK
jgi:hypothetical protein